MAVFVTDRPFRGVEQIKYEQLLADNPQFIKDADKDELEAYLRRLSDRYQQRCAEIVEDADKRWRAAHPGVAGSGEHYAALEAARADAEHIALKEMLET